MKVNIKKGIKSISNYIKKLFRAFKKFLKRFIKIATRPEMRILPGNLAFFLVLAFAPLVTLLALIASRFSIDLAAILNSFQNILPNDIIAVLEVFLNNNNASTGHIIIYLLIGFIAASNGAHSIIVASNTLYNIDSGGFLQRRIKSFFLTVLLLVLFIFILIVMVYGNIILKSILSFEIFTNIADNIYNVFLLFKWPVAFLIIYGSIKVLYAAAPDKNIYSRNVTRGALFTSLGWIIITAVYAYYANNLANYSIFYGSLSNLIVLMMWIYIVSYIFVMGIAINVSHYGNGSE